ncbi:MAG: hypothetical protein JWQ04_2802 [Pedosphaera sp.]|nr:hypothetical protein [Pedosphaera sp.]
MVECGLPKAETRVRFPSPAPNFAQDAPCGGTSYEVTGFLHGSTGLGLGNIRKTQSSTAAYRYQLDNVRTLPFATVMFPGSHRRIICGVGFAARMKAITPSRPEF